MRLSHVSFILVFGLCALNACRLPSQETNSNPAGPQVSALSYPEKPTNHGPLFTVDSELSFYSFSGISGAASPTTGLIKTTLSGSTTTFFSGKQVLFLARDSVDNIYVFTFTPLNGGISSPDVKIISPSGSVSTYCSNCTPGAYNGGIVNSGTIYLSGTNAKSIDSFTTLGSTSTLAGANVDSSTCPDGAGAEARFKGIMGMTTDRNENIYVMDALDQSGTTSCAKRIRKITPAGEVTTIHTIANDENTVSNGLAIDREGNLYYGVQSGIKKLTPSGIESQYCGGTVSSSALPDGSCNTAFLWYPGVIGFDNSGNLVFYEPDPSVQTNVYRFFKISP